LIVAIDFDGTIVDHRYPDVGPEVPGAIRWMKSLQEAGAKLILWTMRDGETLAEAVAFCRGKGVEFWDVNANPGQRSWTQSPKVYAHIYIDDAAFGCPLRENPRAGGRPFVDWDTVGPAILAKVTA
jgi:hydroxymethylpyrimidine pyrophosphatase-like HAD family hydrolase